MAVSASPHRLYNKTPHIPTARRPRSPSPPASPRVTTRKPSLTTRLTGSGVRPRPDRHAFLRGHILPGPKMCPLNTTGDPRTLGFGTMGRIFAGPQKSCPLFRAFHPRTCLVGFSLSNDNFCIGALNLLDTVLCRSEWSWGGGSSDLNMIAKRISWRYNSQ